MKAYKNVFQDLAGGLQTQLGHCDGGVLLVRQLVCQAYGDLSAETVWRTWRELQSIMGGLAAQHQCLALWHCCKDFGGLVPLLSVLFQVGKTYSHIPSKFFFCTVCS